MAKKFSLFTSRNFEEWIYNYCLTTWVIILGNRACYAHALIPVERDLGHLLLDQGAINVMI